MITDRLDLDAAAFEQGTGWAIEPRGACRGDLCVPLPAGALVDGRIDVAAVAAALGMPVVHDDRRGLYAIGPESLSGHALTTAQAPELTLPTIDGDEFHLSSLRGQKVLLVAWAPY